MGRMERQMLLDLIHDTNIFDVKEALDGARLNLDLLPLWALQLLLDWQKKICDRH